MTNIKTYFNAFNAAIEIQNDQFDSQRIKSLQFNA